MDKIKEARHRFQDTHIAGWSYQFVEFEDCIVLCEIYFDKNLKPLFYCDAELIADDITEMYEVFDRMQDAFNKDVISGNIFEEC